MHDIIPAATLILLRDSCGSAPELLMVERGQHLAFAGGAMVFPGGRIEADDAAIASDMAILQPGPAIEPDDLVARIAAIRETLEEVGIAPAIEGLADAAMTSELRRSLAMGRSFHELLCEMDLRLDPHQLHPFARWLPDHVVSRAFDTRFYVARAPDDAEALADGTECNSCHWDTAAGHLALADAGTHSLIFPTRRNLERIGLSSSFDEAVVFAGRYVIETITPWREQRDGEDLLCIPDHLGYPVTSQLFATLNRG